LERGISLACAALLCGSLTWNWGRAEPASLQDPKPTPDIARQDPTRPTPPAGAAPLRPVEEPYLAPVDRRDLIQRFEPKHPLEGMYRLNAMVRPGGRDVLGAEGFLVLGRRHMSLHLQAPGVEADVPQLRAGFRRYRIEHDRLLMESLVGHYNDLAGDMIVEGRGLRLARTISVVGSSLRVLDADGGYLEFVRIE